MTEHSSGGSPALDATVRALETRIVESLEPGDMLASEADLADEFGVSRLTVRESLKVLAGRGLVQLSKGRRPVVREPDSSVISAFLATAVKRDPRRLLELGEVRLALETLSASSAARNATRAAIAAVQGALDDMVSASRRTGHDAQEQYHRSDVAFHESLALASGNRMLALMLASLEDSLHQSFRVSYRGHMERGGTVDEVIEAHRAILDAVKRSDALGAAEAMRAHLLEGERDLRQALFVDSTPDPQPRGVRTS
jgi:GntR family transcriptional regulator, transcriptional repressor for pyruvate dehydrogenase complex